jgi:hypothetical protein
MNKSTTQEFYFRDSRSSEFQRFQKIHSLLFVKDSKIVILMKKGHQHDAQEEKENINQGFKKKNLLRGLVHQNLSNWIRFMLIKVGIHTLSNDLSRYL